jgi:hypothetical protein
MTDLNWVDSIEAKNKEERGNDYFNVEEGDNKIVLLTHAAPLAQKWTGTKYEIAQEGDTNVSIKGVCWVLQDGVIKSAKLPYTVIKQIRALQNDEDWAFTDFPMNRGINIRAKNAGTKEVEYSVIPSPKEFTVPAEILSELAKKPTPESIIEKMKEKVSPAKKDYPQPKDNISPEDVPF